MAAAGAGSASSPPGAQPDPPDWQTTQDGNPRSIVFLVTFAAVLAQTTLASVKPLRILAGVSQAFIRDGIPDAVANQLDNQPLGGRPRKHAPVVQWLVVALKKPLHFHVALKVTSLQQFLALKQALRDRHGLASHLSTSHTQFWSALRYLVFGSQRKTQLVEVDTMVQWTRWAHLETPREVAGGF